MITRFDKFFVTCYDVITLRYDVTCYGVITLRYDVTCYDVITLRCDVTQCTVATVWLQIFVVQNFRINSLS